PGRRRPGPRPDKGRGECACPRRRARSAWPRGWLPAGREAAGGSLAGVGGDPAEGRVDEPRPAVQETLKIKSHRVTGAGACGSGRHAETFLGKAPGGGKSRARVVQSSK